MVGIPGYDLTKAHEEHLERTDRLSVRKGGKVAARQINGGQLLLRVGRYAHELATAVSEWGVIHTQSGEFIVPDVPMRTIIPQSPTLALIAPSLDGTILEPNVAEINSALRADSNEYYFARDLSKCPFGDSVKINRR